MDGWMAGLVYGLLMKERGRGSVGISLRFEHQVAGGMG